ncbi:MAG: endonuclease V [Candidatus Heimdallarchaeota archaeon]|nr:endonuclease V [Candidatus Heimdallarchaeota archaeon]
MNIDEMINIQNSLQKQVQEGEVDSISLIAGFDISFKDNIGVGALVVFKEKEIVDIKYHVAEIDVEYIPGLLAFRELPIFLECWKQLTSKPDLVVFDGHGKIHPRRMGIATQASFSINTPTFGIAKEPYIGEYDEPERILGNYTLVRDGDEVLGAALCTRDGSKPIFVSVGNLMNLQQVITLTLKYSDGSARIPILTLLPDQYSRKYINNMQ